MSYFLGGYWTQIVTTSVACSYSVPSIDLTRFFVFLFMLFRSVFAVSVELFSIELQWLTACSGNESPRSVFSLSAVIQPVTERHLPSTNLTLRHWSDQQIPWAGSLQILPFTRLVPWWGIQSRCDGPNYRAIQVRRLSELHDVCWGYPLCWALADC